MTPFYDYGKSKIAIQNYNQQSDTTMTSFNQNHVLNQLSESSFPSLTSSDDVTKDKIINILTSLSSSPYSSNHLLKLLPQIDSFTNRSISASSESSSSSFSSYASTSSFAEVDATFSNLLTSLYFNPTRSHFRTELITLFLNNLQLRDNLFTSSSKSLLPTPSFHPASNSIDFAEEIVAVEEFEAATRNAIHSGKSEVKRTARKERKHMKKQKTSLTTSSNKYESDSEMLSEKREQEDINSHNHITEAEHQQESHNKDKHNDHRNSQFDPNFPPISNSHTMPSLSSNSSTLPSLPSSTLSQSFSQSLDKSLIPLEIEDEFSLLEKKESKEETIQRYASYAYLSPDLACGICGLFMYRPVTVLCGHSFCQLCLQNFIETQSISCCPISGCGERLTSESSKYVCVSLMNALEKCFPLEYSIARVHNEAIAAISAGRDAEAVQLLSIALNYWPDTFPLHSNRLCSYLRLCNFDMAIKDAKHCTRLLEQSRSDSLSKPSFNSHSFPSPSSSYLQSSHALNTLTALGQAGLITKIYRLAIYAFATALRISSSNETTIDRTKIAHRLLEAYLGVMYSFHHPSTSSTSKPNSFRIYTGSSATHEAPAVATMTSSPSPINSVNPIPPLSTFLFPSWLQPPFCNPSPFHPITQHNRGTERKIRSLHNCPTSREIDTELQCFLCLSTLYEPVTTVCGHTFCRLCLGRSLDHKNLCPFCRASLSLHISPTRQAVNITLRAMLQRWCESKYEKRHEVIVAELQEQSLYLPIFVCTLMFPGVSCPLHIFEPRYRLMIRSVLESGYNRFGMCVETDKKGNYLTVGCTAEIKSVRLLPDGRSLVDTVGGRRFTVKEKNVRNGYDVGRIEWIDDISPEEELALYANASPSFAELKEQLKELVDEMLLPRLSNFFDIESQLGVMPSIDHHVIFAYWICAVLPMRMTEKYAFLQYRSDYERFKKLRDVMIELESKEFN